MLHASVEAENTRLPIARRSSASLIFNRITTRRKIKMTIYTADNHLPTDEIELQVETVEEVIAPGFNLNHSETVEVELTAEELEEVVAPGVSFNHNEALAVDLVVE